MKPKSSLNSEVQEKKYKVNDLTYSKAYDRIKKKKKGIEELNIANIFTLEASFCGADKGNFKDQHFSTDYLMMAGRRLL